MMHGQKNIKFFYQIYYKNEAFPSLTTMKYLHS